MVARPWSSSRISCGECLLLRCDGNAGNSFPTTQGKDPSSGTRRRKRVSSGCGRDSRASSRVESGISGNFLSCSKGVRTLWKFQRLGVLLLETSQQKWASSHLLGKLQKYPKFHVSTGEESSGSSPDSTQGLRPRHRWERNPERHPSNSHWDWPFLRPSERVPEVPVVSREHLPHLEKIQEVLPSRRF